MIKLIFLIILLLSFNLSAAVPLGKVGLLITKDANAVKYQVQSDFDRLMAGSANITDPSVANSGFLDLMKKDYIPTAHSPMDAGMTPLTNEVSASSGYSLVSNLDVPVGDQLATIQVESIYSKAELAGAVLSLIPRLSGLGLAITAGSLLAKYLADAGLSFDPSTGKLLKDKPDLAGSGYYLNVIPDARTPACGGESEWCHGGCFTYAYMCKLWSICSPSYDDYLQSHGVCRISNTSVPTTKDEAKTALIDVAPTNPAPLLKEMVNASPTALPDVSSSPSIKAFPRFFTSPEQSTVSPEGTLQKRKSVTTLTQTAPNTITATDTVTTETTQPDGSTKTIVTTGPPTTSKDCLSSNCCPTDCDKYPDSLGCLKLGEAPINKTIPVTEAVILLNPVSLGVGICPAPKTIMLANGTKSITMSYQLYCDFATKINPFAWLTAGFIVVGGLRDS